MRNIMAKLGNFYQGNTFYVSQSPHGANQNNKAIDTVPGDKFILPYVGGQKVSWLLGKTGSFGTQQAWFNLIHPSGKFYLQIVHAEPPKVLESGQTVRCMISNNHVHVAINVEGAWYVVLDFLERNILLKPSGNFSSQHWFDWESWADRSLPITTVNMTKINTLKEFLSKDWIRNDILSHPTYRDRPDLWWDTYSWKEVPPAYRSVQASLSDSKLETQNSNKQLNEKDLILKTATEELQKVREASKITEGLLVEAERDLVAVEHEKETLKGEINRLQNELEIANTALNECQNKDKTLCDWILNLFKQFLTWLQRKK